jgi:glycosyltransferase involved in cell wall biosynthesis
MKIGFDASDLSTGRADGTTRYTRELIRRLPLAGRDHAWQAFAPGDKPGDFPPAPNLSWHASPWPAAWTQMRLPIDLYRFSPDVLFMPIQQLPYVRPKRMKTVAVIHDLAVHLYPEQFRAKDWLLLHAFSAYAAREADAIIAVSQATADDVARFYGRREGVHVVHHGVDHARFYAPSSEERTQAAAEIAAALPRLKEPYLLYVGQLQPRKNLVRLLEAFAQLKTRQPRLSLVIAGGHGWLKQPILEAVERSPAAADIILAGTIPDQLLARLYWQADVFILPSLYEGFGMPLLEAMASGCPAVGADTSSLPEVAGGAAVLVDPLSAESIAAGIEEAQRRREELREKGIRRAGEFTWEATTRRTLEVITSL